MKRRAGLLFLLVPLLLIGIHAPSAYASAILPPIDEPLPPIIEEEVFFSEEEQAPEIVYTVFNPGENAAGPFSFIAFAVETLLFGDQVVGGETYESRFSWNSALLTQAMWDGDVVGDPLVVPGQGFAFGVDPFNPGAFGADKPFRTGRDLGGYVENFGGGDILAAQVAFYFDNEGTQNQIAPGTGDTGFTFSHPFLLLASDTVGAFLDPQGQILSAGGVTSPPGTITAIPLPSAAWMGLGLLGILAAARRRRRAR